MSRIDPSNLHRYVGKKVVISSSPESSHLTVVRITGIYGEEVLFEGRGPIDVGNVRNYSFSTLPTAWTPLPVGTYTIDSDVTGGLIEFYTEDNETRTPDYVFPAA